MEKNQYKASWRVHAFSIVVPILILKFSNNLDIRARLFIMTILAWHIIDVLNGAIDDGLKYNEEYKCTHTASTLSDEVIVAQAYEKNSSEKE
jgi:hypothetical protein